MTILYGKSVSDNILADLKEKISQKGSIPGLAVILIGNDQASNIYVGLKEKRAKETGVDFFLFQFAVNVDEEDVILKIRDLNGDAAVNGIIVQLPLPEKFDTQRIVNEIVPEKDVDGFHPKSIAKFQEGKDLFWPVFPKAIVTLLESSQEDIKNKSAIVVANSEKFGEVMSNALERKGMRAGYVLADAVVENIKKIKNSDIVVTAVGRPGIIKGSMIKKGAIVIDGGIAKEKERVVGDVDFESAKNVAKHISPVPGGVGPVTIACLLENVYAAYQNQAKK